MPPKYNKYQTIFGWISYKASYLSYTGLPETPIGTAFRSSIYHSHQDQFLGALAPIFYAIEEIPPLFKPYAFLNQFWRDLLLPVIGFSNIVVGTFTLIYLSLMALNVIFLPFLILVSLFKGSTAFFAILRHIYRTTTWWINTVLTILLGCFQLLFTPVNLLIKIPLRLTLTIVYYLNHIRRYPEIPLEKAKYLYYAGLDTDANMARLNDIDHEVFEQWKQGITIFATYAPLPQETFDLICQTESNHQNTLLNGLSKLSIVGIAEDKYSHLLATPKNLPHAEMIATAICWLYYGGLLNDQNVEYLCIEPQCARQVAGGLFILQHHNILSEQNIKQLISKPQYAGIIALNEAFLGTYKLLNGEMRNVIDKIINHKTAITYLPSITVMLEQFHQKHLFTEKQPIRLSAVECVDYFMEQFEKTTQHPSNNQNLVLIDEIKTISLVIDWLRSVNLDTNKNLKSLFNYCVTYKFKLGALLHTFIEHNKSLLNQATFDAMIATNANNHDVLTKLVAISIKIIKSENIITLCQLEFYELESILTALQILTAKNSNITQNMLQHCINAKEDAETVAQAWLMLLEGKITLSDDIIIATTKRPSFATNVAKGHLLLKNKQLLDSKNKERILNCIAENARSTAKLIIELTLNTEICDSKKTSLFNLLDKIPNIVAIANVIDLYFVNFFSEEIITLINNAKGHEDKVFSGLVTLFINNHLTDKNKTIISKNPEFSDKLAKALVILEKSYLTTSENIAAIEAQPLYAEQIATIFALYDQINKAITQEEKNIIITNVAQSPSFVSIMSEFIANKKIEDSARKSDITQLREDNIYARAKELEKIRQKNKAADIENAHAIIKELEEKGILITPSPIVWSTLQDLDMAILWKYLQAKKLPSDQAALIKEYAIQNPELASLMLATLKILFSMRKYTEENLYFLLIAIKPINSFEKADLYNQFFDQIEVDRLDRFIEFLEFQSATKKLFSIDTAFSDLTLGQIYSGEFTVSCNDRNSDIQDLDKAEQNYKQVAENSNYYSLAQHGLIHVLINQGKPDGFKMLVYTETAPHHFFKKAKNEISLNENPSEPANKPTVIIESPGN